MLSESVKRKCRYIICVICWLKFIPFHFDSHTRRFAFENDLKKRLVWWVNHCLLLLQCAYTNLRLFQSIWYFESGNALRLAWVVTFAFQIDVETFWHVIFLMRDPDVFVQLLNQCFCTSIPDDGDNNAGW